MNKPTVPTTMVDQSTQREAGTSQEIIAMLKMWREAGSNEIHFGTLMPHREEDITLGEVLDTVSQPEPVNRNEMDLIQNGYPASIGIIESDTLQSRMAALDQAIQGNGDIVTSACDLLGFLQDSLSEVRPAVIRCFMEGGLIQAVTGLPVGAVLRRIDLDCEGGDEARCKPLRGDDVPPYCDRDCDKLRGFIGEFLPDGSQRDGKELSAQEVLALLKIGLESEEGES